jgi:hypothetical protein
MKKHYSFVLALAIFSVGSLTAQIDSYYGLNVQELSNSKWNTADGIPYKQVPGVNLGATSFEVLTGNKIAYLCNATNEVIITDEKSGTMLSKFPVLFAPRDFAYDNGFFYVLNSQLVAVYDDNGKFLKNITFPASYTGIERLARYNNETYLLLPSGNSLKIKSGGNQVDAKEYEGWPTSAGYFIKTKINNGNSYSFTVITADGKRYDKTFTTNGRAAGAYVVGATQSRIYLDIQTFVTESPISVERDIVSIEMDANGIGPVVTSIKVPNCYYVLSNNDFHLSSTGSILNMVTAPQGLYIYSLSEMAASLAKGYPDFLTAMKYHFNDHLLIVDKK